MNPFSVSGISVERRRIGLKTPFITALGRKDATENVFIRLRLANGAEGWGEASGSVVMAHLSAPRLERTVRSLAAPLKGRDARRLAALAPPLFARAAAAPAAAAAVECALTDCLRTALGLGWGAWFGGRLGRLETDATLSAAGPDETRRAAARAAGEGFRVLKVKVGTGFAADLERAAAADAAGRRRGRRPSLILDGNQRLGRAGAVRLSEACLARGLRPVLIEQPLPADDLAGMAWVSRRAPVPVAADESVQRPADARAVLEAGAAAVVNIKVAKMGLQAALETIAVVRAAGAGLMIGCMQESALGLSPSVGLALGTGAFAWCDLDSDWLLADSQPRGWFSRAGAWLSAP
ncbi:MAG: dipeptide epimerase [Elusimicrobia bacterium]|nr:dipeptide epimerase [Elusimicrobiota bacterium]